ncbi:MAG: hypoxanthine phosphoribosyltransferase [Massilibacteroides sp.]|nr:hypoxanthine phosphoribosyltransferase [Massilibacteroides sp.]MDD3063878.1 hypoxanthine phosphoribosyltransferase [Massilibacteroides sp.]MDD4661357.1 hypoxanthine phosphoribosyltransferase [Massilibacteroides sp.]
MEKIRLRDKEFKLFISEKQIQEVIGKVAEQIKKDLGERNPLFVGVLNGAFMFVAELMRQMNGPYELTFARYSSYKGTNTTGSIHEIMPLTVDVKDRTVVLLEDIVDTGYTMRYVMDKLRREGAREVRLATMLLKPDALKCDLKPDYVGLEIPNDFIVGYGLDYDEMGRAYRDIYSIV